MTATANAPIPVGTIAYSRPHRRLVRVTGYVGKLYVVHDLWDTDGEPLGMVQRRSLRLFAKPTPRPRRAPRRRDEWVMAQVQRLLARIRPPA